MRIPHLAHWYSFVLFRSNHSSNNLGPPSNALRRVTVISLRGFDPRTQAATRFVEDEARIAWIEGQGKVAAPEHFHREEARDREREKSEDRPRRARREPGRRRAATALSAVVLHLEK